MHFLHSIEIFLLKDTLIALQIQQIQINSMNAKKKRERSVVSKVEFKF